MLFEHWPYLSVFLVLLAAGFGVPIPEDIPLLMAGVLCHAGRAELVPMITLAMVGVLGADLLLFCLGKRFGEQITEHRFVRRLVNRSRLSVAEDLFATHGVKIIFAGRFMPGLRPMVFMAAGVLKIRLIIFLAVDGIAALISVPILIMLGKVFGENYDRLQSGVRSVTHLIGLGLVTVALAGGAIYVHRRQKRMMRSASPGHPVDSKPSDDVTPAQPDPPGESDKPTPQSQSFSPPAGATAGSTPKS